MEVVDSVSCLHASRRRDGKQTNEFLGQLIDLGHVLEHDVVSLNVHMLQCNSATSCACHAVCIII